jgi:hypothetical protein
MNSCCDDIKERASALERCESYQIPKPLTLNPKLSRGANPTKFLNPKPETLNFKHQTTNTRQAEFVDPVSPQTTNTGQ